MILLREIADWSPNPEQQYTQAELREILSKTIQGLPPGFRTVFVLRDVEGLSTEETAAALELSVPAVKSMRTAPNRERTSEPSRPSGSPFAHMMAGLD